MKERTFTIVIFVEMLLDGKVKVMCDYVFNSIISNKHLKLEKDSDRPLLLDEIKRNMDIYYSKACRVLVETNMTVAKICLLMAMNLILTEPEFLFFPVDLNRILFMEEFLEYGEKKLRKVIDEVKCILLSSEESEPSVFHMPLSS